MTSEGETECTVLVVCTGNICRSPAAERLLSSALGPSVTVESAGTHALAGQPMAPPMRHLVEGQSAVAEDFTARQLNAHLVRQADLVLAMTRAHRSAVVQLWPAAVRRSFTLREFARLLESVDPADLPEGSPADRIRAAIPLAAGRRGRVKTPSGADDVVDPYRQTEQVYAASFAELLPAVQSIARIITDPN